MVGGAAVLTVDEYLLRDEDRMRIHLIGFAAEQVQMYYQYNFYILTKSLI